MNNKLNVKTIKRDFESCVRDCRSQLMEFGKLIVTYEQLPWVPGTNPQEITKYDGIKNAVNNLILEARANINRVEETFRGLVARWNERSIKPVDFNFEVIMLTQQLFQHQEYIAIDGLSQMQEGITLKIKYIEEYKKTQQESPVA